MEKIKKLDLHGLCHDDALDHVKKLLYSNWRLEEVELEIVTGKGELRLKVEELLQEHHFVWHYHPLNNMGCIRVIE